MNKSNKARRSMFSLRLTLDVYMNRTTVSGMKHPVGPLEGFRRWSKSEESLEMVAARAQQYMSTLTNSYQSGIMSAGIIYAPAITSSMTMPSYPAIQPVSCGILPRV